MKSKLKKNIYDKPLVIIILIALTLNFLLELFNRRSFVTTFVHFVKTPLTFLCSTLIVAVTLSVGLLMKRKIFTFSLISAAWLTIGVTNFVLLGYRTTPLSNVDFKIIKSALGLITVYLSTVQIILISLLILAAVTVIIILWFKAPKQKIALKNSLAVIIVLIVSTTLLAGFAINAQTVSYDFANLTQAYEDYGFVYCFSRTVLDSGIDMPETYDKSTVDDIAAKIIYETPSPEVMPNIIAIQLESFFDVKYLTNPLYKTKTDPVPNFTRLRDESISGFLTVPLFGSGTAYTEFEVLTGIDTDLFGLGECPYFTAVNNHICDSAAYALKKYGYTTHAIHNNTGTFYDRNIVYPNLGFDTFTPLEHMYNVEYTEYGWAKDYILTDSITDCMNSTDGNDFIFAVSVQPHGNYPDETPTSAYEYYVKQLQEVDEFLDILTKKLAESDEPTMLVLYGDHLPALDFTKDDIVSQNLYQTEYVIWANYELHDTDEDIYTYELFARVFDITGLDAGAVINARGDDLAEDDISALAYDMLYGENYMQFDNEPTDMQMGIDKIEITGIYKIGDSVRIRGNNFNEYSIGFINGSEQDTVYIDSKTLIIPDENIMSGAVVSVGQISVNKTVLSETNQFKYINYNEEEKSYE